MDPESSKDLEGKKTDLDEIRKEEEELCGLFEADISLCHVNDRWAKIEAVADSGAAESVALACVAPLIPTTIAQNNTLTPLTGAVVWQTTRRIVNLVRPGCIF